MALPVLRLAALLLALPGPPGGAAPPLFSSPADLPAIAVVAVESLETFTEANDTAFVLDRLDKGEAIRVIDTDPDSGWLTIEPPAKAFAWIDQSAVRPEGPGSARVSTGSAQLRAGVAGARMPGPPRGTLKRGELVRLLDRPPLRTGERTWLAIGTPAKDVRYVRRDGVSKPGLTAERSAPTPTTSRETRASFVEGPPAGLDRLPPGLGAEVAQIEAEHRAALSGPVESWDLLPVQRRYEALLKRTDDPSSKDAVQARLDLVARQAQIARSARTIQTILERSRRRDRDVATARRNLDEMERPQHRPFVAEGLVQASSRQVEGRRIYVLVGPDGVPVAYLDIPPGLDARHMLSKRVGVRGSVRYNEALGSRLIAVRDLEPLEK